MSNKNEMPVVDIDDIPVNPSTNPWLSEVIASRRNLLKGGLGLALGGFLGGHFSGCAATNENASPSVGLKNVSPKIGFTSVPLQHAQDFDRVLVADGYTARAFFSWGDEVVTGAVPWKADASNSLFSLYRCTERSRVTGNQPRIH
jgi:secreted PhoX family phosphatase